MSWAWDGMVRGRITGGGRFCITTFTVTAFMVSAAWGGPLGLGEGFALYHGRRRVWLACTQDQGVYQEGVHSREWKEELIIGRV